MKVKVVKQFIDKNTGKLMKVGTAKKPTIIEMSEERYNELVEAGAYVVEAKDDEINASTLGRRTTADILDDVLHDMTVEELKKHALKYDVDLTGIRNKSEIIEAIKVGGVVDASESDATTVNAQNDSEEMQDDSEETQNDSDDTQDDSEKSIDDMTVAELKDYAKEHDIDLNGARTKPEIADAINATKK